MSTDTVIVQKNIYILCLLDIKYTFSNKTVFSFFESHRSLLN